MIAACAATPPAPPVVAAATPTPVDLSPGTSDRDAAGQVNSGTDPARDDPACPPRTDRPRRFAEVNARAGLADFFKVDPATVSPGWFTAQETPWLPAVTGVAAGRLAAGDATAVGVLVFDGCADRADHVCSGASVRLPDHDRVTLAALVDLQGEPGGIPVQPRAPVFTMPAGGCTRMPALVVHATGHDTDADRESLLLLSLTGDSRVLHKASFSRADGGESLARLALVQGLADAPPDLDVTVQRHLRRGSRCMRPDPVTTRHRLVDGSYTAIGDGQLRAGCS